MTSIPSLPSMAPDDRLGSYLVPDFIRDLQNVSPGNLRALWLPAPTDTTTNGQKPDGRTWTNSATIQGRITAQGNGILVSFASASSHHTSTPDTADLSFGDGATDSPFSIVVCANVTSTGATKQLLTKDGAGTGNREYQIAVTAGGNLRVILVDDSAGVTANLQSNSAVTQGSLAVVGMSYVPNGGGTTAWAAAGSGLFQNGVAIAATETSNASYVAMEGLSQKLDVGSAADGATNLLNGSVGFAALYAGALTEAQHAQIANFCRRFYGAALS